MRKHTKLISIIISLTMLIGVVLGIGISSYADEGPENSANLTVGENIVSHYYIDAEYYRSHGCDSIRYTYNGMNDKEQYSTVDSGLISLGNDKYFVIDAYQAAAQIAEPTVIEIIKNGEVFDTVNYSSKTYCDSIINMAPSDYESFSILKGRTLASLCKAIVAYGKSAQEAFNYSASTVNGATTITDDYSSELNIESASYTPSVSKTAGDNVAFRTASFMCTSSAKMRFYLSVNNESDSTLYADPEITMPNGASYEKGYVLNGSAKTYYIQINNIKPVDFDEKLIINYAGASVSMSVLDYAGAVINSSAISAKDKTLAKSIIVYNSKAEDYFADHTMQAVEAVSPTCTEAGSIAYYKCTDCGKLYADFYGDVEVTEEETVVAALGHNYTSVVTQPTCTEQGYTTYTCTRCGDSYVADYTDMIPHTEGSWTVKTAATDSSDGVEIKTCSVCGTELSTRTVSRFTHKFSNKDTYLYRVGNSNAVKLGTLFDSESGADIAGVTATITTVSGNASATFTANASDWRESTIKFANEGVVTVTLKHGTATAATLNLEVVNGKNITTYSQLSTGSTNIMLSDIALASNARPIITGTVYGNGFIIDATKGQTTQTGVIWLNNGKLDNIVINGPVQNEYVDTFGKTGYASTVCSEGDGSVITNCRITGGQTPLRINSVATVKDSVLSGGLFANIDVRGGEFTAENITTVNTQNSLGIVVANGASSATKIIINGTLTQHNFVNENTAMSNSNATTLRNTMFGNAYAKYQFTSGGIKYINTGIISMSPNFNGSNIIDNRADKRNYSGMTATIVGQKGYVYTMENTDSSMLETSYTEPEYTPSVQKLYEPAFTWALAAADTVAAGGNEHCYKDSSGKLQIQFLIGSSKTLDVASLPTVKKYSSYSYTPTVSCTDPNGTAVAVSNGKVTFDKAGVYTLSYTYTDTNVYDKSASKTNNETYTKTIKVNVAVKKQAPDATITSSADTGTIVWGKAGRLGDYDYNPCIPFLNGLTISDYDANGNPYTVLDGDSQESFIKSLASVSVSGTTVTMILANGTKLVVNGPAVDGSVQIKTYNNVMYYCDSTADNNPAVFTKNFAAKSYTYTGENGVAVSYAKARSFTSTTSTNTIANYSALGQAWTSNKFLMYDAQGGTVSPTYENSSPATLKTPIREGYTFLNWNTKADGTGTAKSAGASQTFSSTTTLYAIWAKNITVSFDKNGGSSVSYANIEGGAGSSATLPSASFAGNWLEGWYTESDGGTRIGKAGETFTIPASDTTYFVHWSQSYTVTYNANGGTVSVPGALYEGSAILLPAPTNGSKTFEGWYTAAEGGTKVGSAGDSYTPTANIELFAQWSENILVTFNGNGGTAETNSATYDRVNAITLPSATRAGHKFNGWYTEASGGDKVGDAGANYSPSENTTLYAQWTAYSVTYDANGGSVSPASASAESDGTVSLPTPTRTGYTFDGWYDGDTKVGSSGSYTPSANKTLTAHWNINSYNVTITTSNSSTAVTVNGNTVSSGGSVEYNSVVKVELSYTQTNSLTFTIKQGSNNVTYYSDEACTSSTTSTAAGTYYFKMPAGDVTINSSSASGGGCITPDTLVTLADGTQKRADELTGEEELLVWNLETGSYSTAPILFIDDSDPEQENNVIHLFFSDGTETKLIYEHGYFDVDEGKYVYITEENYRDYIGDRFVKIDSIENNTWKTVKLVDSEITSEYVKPYGPTTSDEFCFFVDGMLSMPGGIKGLFNIFDVDVATMTYDFDAMQRDIETYGLYTYEDFDGLLSREVFEIANCAYLKVSVGKGLMTWEDVVQTAQRYAPLAENFFELS